jgi:threonine dehydratase
VITIETVREVRPVVGRVAVRTPLVELPGGGVHLKLENLQPIGSFKIRGIHAQMEAAGGKAVLTASAGNAAQAVAFCARRRGVPATIVMPETAPEAKRRAVERLGGRIVTEPFERWWRVFAERSYPGVEATFIHPFAHPLMIAGNGTIGLEILEDLPGVRTVLVPWGGGGLACGIAVALRALKPDVAIWAVEAETAAPLGRSWEAGEPREIDYVPSFVDGIGAKAVVAEMFWMARGLLDGVVSVSLEAARAAVRRIALEARVVAEGAGAVALAAAARFPGPVACIVSGGTIDAVVLAEIIASSQDRPA